MNHSEEWDYPSVVYENMWEDLEIMHENWKAVHGVDHQYCIEIIRKFANDLEAEIR